MLPDWPPPQVWQPYGTEPLPSRAEALALPLKAFPGWFLSIRCERCGETRIAANEGRTPWPVSYTHLTLPTTPYV